MRNEEALRVRKKRRAEKERKEREEKSHTRKDA